MNIALPSANPRELNLRDFMGVEYQTDEGKELRLTRRMSAPLKVGERFEGEGVEHGKLLEFMATSRFAPVGFDLLPDASWPEPGDQGPLVLVFSDGAAAIATADTLGASTYCNCSSRGHCPHRMALVFLLGLLDGTAEAWFLEDELVEQLRVAVDAYRMARTDTKALLLACDAGYVCVRDRFRVQIDDRELRRELAARLGMVVSPGTSRHAGSRSAFAEAFSGLRTS